MMTVMGAEQPDAGEGASDLLALYDRALPQVYGYLVSRCGSPALAEDLTAETFLAAVAALQRGTAELSVGWLVTVARRKLVDHWRRSAREERKLQLAAGEPVVEEPPWDEQLDATRAGVVLGELGSHHRAALTLRYVDGLPVPEVAQHLDRTVHATEALLVRARSAFRRAYGERRGDGD
jgi:RNA polymerase sigma-70 factor (ECF subfamily)